MKRMTPPTAIVLVDDDGEEFTIDRSGAYVTINSDRLPPQGGRREITIHSKDAQAFCDAIMEKASG